MGEDLEGIITTKRCSPYPGAFSGRRAEEFVKTEVLLVERDGEETV